MKQNNNISTKQFRIGQQLKEFFSVFCKQEKINSSELIVSTIESTTEYKDFMKMLQW